MSSLPSNSDITAVRTIDLTSTDVVSASAVPTTPGLIIYKAQVKHLKEIKKKLEIIYFKKYLKVILQKLFSIFPNQS